jgi:hypothetical protein
MERGAYERMERRVRAIHRALTGDDPRPDDAASSDGENGRAEGSAPAQEEIERRFTELALEARTHPRIAGRLDDELERAPAEHAEE